MDINSIEKHRNDENPTREKVKNTLQLSKGQQLVQEFAELGTKSKLVELKDNPDFSEMIILDNPAPTQPVVRIYRGVKYLCTSLLDQIPYAMRSEHKEGESWKSGSTPIKIEEVQEEVQQLAERPTYENLLKYYEKVQDYLNEDEKWRMEDGLKEAEDDVLKHGHSLRKSLIHINNYHVGTHMPTSGITPYISASFDAREAMGYGGRAIMAIDLPIENIEDWFQGEVGIRGKLENQQVTAIFLRKKPTSSDYNTKGFFQAIEKLNEIKPMPLIEEEDLEALRTEERFLKLAIDEDNKEKDILDIKNKRVRYLLNACPEANLNIEEIKTEAEEMGVDFYKLTQEKLFDFYEQEFNKIWGGKYPLKGRAYRKRFGTGSIKREEMNDEMLSQMPELMKAEREFKKRKDDERKLWEVEKEQRRREASQNQSK